MYIKIMHIHTSIILCQGRLIALIQTHRPSPFAVCPSVFPFYCFAICYHLYDQANLRFMIMTLKHILLYCPYFQTHGTNGGICSTVVAQLTTDQQVERSSLHQMA